MFRSIKSRIFTVVVILSSVLLAIATMAPGCSH
jgi:hypothetical protein